MVHVSILFLVDHFVVLSIMHAVTQVYFLLLRSSYYVHGPSRSSRTLILFALCRFSQTHLSFLSWALMCISVVARLLTSPYIVAVISLHAMHMGTWSAIALELILGV